MSVFNLPPLTQTIVEPDRPGRWVPIDDLAWLAEALKIDERELEAGDIKSIKNIPDAWAQVQLVIDALFKRPAETYEHVRGQWRALLALFALQPIHQTDYRLSIQTFKSAPERKTRDGAYENIWRSQLHRVLHELAPRGALCGLDWSQVAIIDFVSASEGGSTHVALGMLSPLTLVAPGRTAADFSHQAVPWLKGGLIDPLKAGGFRPESWEIVAKYLEDLIEAVGTCPVGPAEEQAHKNRLLHELQSFEEECLGRIPTPRELDRVSLNTAQWPEGFFRKLAATYTPKQKNGKASECLLRLRSRAAGGLFTGVILADPNLEQTLGRPAHEIRVWREHTLLEVNSPESLKRIREEAKNDGYALVTPADFFTDELVRMDKETSVAAHSGALGDKLLPLSPLALLCSTAEGGLASAVGLETEGDTQCATFVVELSEQRQNAHIKHQLKREFGPDSVVEMLPPDDLGLWPDFAEQGWPWTFLRYQYDPATDLHIRFGLTPEVIVSDIAAAAKPKDKERRLADWASASSLAADARLFGAESLTMRDSSDGKPLIDRFRFIQTDSLVAEQHHFYRGVEAIFFSRRKGDGDLPVGCIAVSRKGKTLTKAATVSIDFGTSNTVAYYRVDDGPPQRTLFKNRVVFPIEQQDEGVLASTYADFFPLQDHDTPLPTVMKARDFDGNLSAKLLSYIETPSAQNRVEGGRDRSILGVTHMLFFMPWLGRTVNPELLVAQIRSGQLKFDLKWQEGSEASFIISCYLRQLMIMIAAELCDLGVKPARIAWRFSYPQAFGTLHAANFRGVVKRLAERMRAELGVDGDATPRLRTEGEAAASYFTDDPTQKLKGPGALLLMLDIGGGTTEMAIRSSKRLIWRGSVRLAGSNFFRQYLVNNIDVLQTIDPDLVAQFQAGAASPGDRELQLPQLVDLLIAKPSFPAEFESQYLFHAVKPAWRGLRQSAAVALGGMMHYLGLVLKDLIDAGLIPASQLADLSVALGGRGSTIFRQFDAPEGEKSHLGGLCRLAAIAGGATGDVNIRPTLFSESPKEEVARGLLIDAAGADKAAGPPDRRLPLGLAVTVTGKGKERTLAANAGVEALLESESISNIAMTEFETFIKRLGEEAGLAIDIASEGAGHTIRNIARGDLGSALVDAHLASKQSEWKPDADSQVIEPPFITALRSLVMMMSAPIQKRDATLGVRQKGS